LVRWGEGGTDDQRQSVFRLVFFWGGGLVCFTRGGKGTATLKTKPGKNSSPVEKVGESPPVCEVKGRSLNGIKRESLLLGGEKKNLGK